MPKTRQAKSIQRIRKTRRKAGLCFECGRPSDTYRCSDCNAVRRDKLRDYMADYMRRIRAKR